MEIIFYFQIENIHSWIIQYYIHSECHFHPVHVYMFICNLTSHNWNLIILDKLNSSGYLHVVNTIFLDTFLFDLRPFQLHIALHCMRQPGLWTHNQQLFFLSTQSSEYLDLSLKLFLLHIEFHVSFNQHSFNQSTSKLSTFNWINCCLEIGLSIFIVIITLNVNGFHR